MDEDKKLAKRMSQYSIGQDLSEFSIDELSVTISALENEIKRLQATKAEKSNHLSAAEAFFKK
jgi:uncharacterized small protein (DUF1192 family)